MEMKLAKKRYYKSFAISMGLYLIGMIGVSLMRKYMDFSIFILYGLTLVPILALLYGIAEHWHYVNSMDEYLRSRQIKAMMVGLALMLSISASWGILEEVADVARLPSLWFLVIFCVGYGVTEAFLNHRDKKHD